MSSINRNKTVLILLILVIAVGLTTGCSSSGKRKELAFSDVELTTDPAAPITGKNTKMIVTITDSSFAKQEADVQLQINSKSTLPLLIDATKEGENYTATCEFKKAEDYTVTVHLSYEEDHYSFAKQITVTE